jgi:hypothetical protein
MFRGKDFPQGFRLSELTPDEKIALETLNEADPIVAFRERTNPKKRKK